MPEQVAVLAGRQRRTALRGLYSFSLGHSADLGTDRLRGGQTARPADARRPTAQAGTPPRANRCAHPVSRPTPWRSTTRTWPGPWPSFAVTRRIRSRFTTCSREVPVSRRWLERRFCEVLGRGPGAEIRRVRLARAKRLLADTDMPVPDVARLAGFGSREYLAAVFKSELDLSPRQYRNRTQDATVMNGASRHFSLFHPYAPPMSRICHQTSSKVVAVSCPKTVN